MSLSRCLQASEHLGPPLSAASEGAVDGEEPEDAPVPPPARHFSGNRE